MPHHASAALTCDKVWYRKLNVFAHLERIVGLHRLGLRAPFGARDEFLLAATAQNLRMLANLIPRPQPATG